MSFSRSIFETMSALCTRKVLPCRNVSAFFNAPPVPRIGSSGKKVIEFS
jgi:hypothetical protein